jgi:hypothetical protein
MVLASTKFLGQNPSPIFCDNDAAIKLAEDQVWHSKCKHIRVKYHFVRDQVVANEVRINRVRTHDNLADIFTKALGRTDFLRHRHKLGLVAPALEEESRFAISFLPLLPFNAYHVLHTYHSSLSTPFDDARVEEEC